MKSGLEEIANNELLKKAEKRRELYHQSQKLEIGSKYTCCRNCSQNRRFKKSVLQYTKKIEVSSHTVFSS